jgi:hypothetical protein
MVKDYLILEGKSLDDIIEKGLKETGRTIDEVDVEVLEEKKSIIGFKKRYKVKISIKEAKKSESDNNVIDLKLDNEKEKSSYYDIIYKEDGVYLCVFQGAEDIKIQEKEIIFKLDRKKIIDCDISAVRRTIEEGNGEYVKIAPPQKEEYINSEIIIDIASDEMTAYAILLPPEGGKELNYEEALEYVNNRIKYGIIKEQIEKMVKSKLYNQKLVIAKGKTPINGKDGEIKYYFNTKNKVTLEVLEDGSVDLRNLHLINNVKENDILAEIIPATEGEAGITVTGRVIPQKVGKNPVLKKGKNVELSEDSLKLISKVNGQACLENDKVSVYEVYTVKGDVDNSTGNINFNGSVKVKGNVRTGFEIKCKGNVEIEGVVEGAVIESEGNILLKRGIQGHFKGKLNSTNDILARYIENCNIHSNGNISSEVIMHSNVVCRGTIDVTKGKGLIVGGICKATKEIKANIIGSSMETNTVLEVGVDPEIKNRYETKKKEKLDVEDQINRLCKSINVLNRLAKSDKLTEQKRQMLVNCLKAQKILSEKLEKLKRDILDLESQIELLSSGKITVNNIIYPGVKITIGNSVMFVKEEIRKCVIFNQDGEIKVSYIS